MSEKSFAAKTAKPTSLERHGAALLFQLTVKSAVPWQVSMKHLCEVLGFQSPFGLPCQPPGRLAGG